MALEAQFYLKTLQRIVSQPTASFHEELVCSQITAFLKEIGVPFEIDRWGNIIAHYKKGHSPHPLAFMAHTDHPAFELLEKGTTAEIKGANWTAKLMGVVSAKCFEQPSNVKLYPSCSAEASLGRIVGHRLGPAGPDDVTLYLEVVDDKGLEPGNFGVWDLPDFKLRDGFVNARVIDDLVGCAATMLVLWKLVNEGVETQVYGVFTRAEEVGSVGANLILQNNGVPRDCFIVSVEASKIVPGVVQGEGPVIRVGDRGFTFSETAEFILKAAADKMGSDVVKVREAKVKIQRQLMSGGCCEASVALMNGYAATGLAFPLGNYHNVGDNFTLQPENIHEQDFITGVELLYEAARLMPQYEELVAEQQVVENNPSKYAGRLLQTTNIICAKAQG